MGLSSVNKSMEDNDDGLGSGTFVSEHSCLSLLEEKLTGYLKKLEKIDVDILSPAGAHKLKVELDGNVNAASTLCDKVYGDLISFGEYDGTYRRAQELLSNLKSYQKKIDDAINKKPPQSL
jgi:hypothetical protein